MVAKEISLENGCWVAFRSTLGQALPLVEMRLLLLAAWFGAASHQARSTAEIRRPFGVYGPSPRKKVGRRIRAQRWELRQALGHHGRSVVIQR